MATTHLTDLQASGLALPDILRRVEDGEYGGEIRIQTSSGSLIVIARAEHAVSQPPLDGSVEATLERLRTRETHHWVAASTT